MSDTSFGGGLGFGSAPTAGGAAADVPVAPPVAAAPQPQAEDSGQTFGGAIRSILPGPQYRAPDPAASALDQTADTLQQRIKRANDVATNPMLQFFNPEGVAAARDFVPKATEQLQTIRKQKAEMEAGRIQASTLGLAPGEVPDEATTADRVEVAKARALAGDLKVFKGLQAVDPKSAEAIQDQVHETVAGHLDKAQYAFDSLSGMTNQGQYQAKLSQLRKEGTLTDLETLGLKVPASFDAFNSSKGREAQALREARIGVNTIRQKLEDRNTYQPMEEKEAKTYSGRLTTVAGDQITNGTWARNGAAGTRGLVVNGAADPRTLGKNFTLASPEQRKAIKEEFDGALPKEELEKYRAFTRTYQMATTDAKGNPVADGTVNTNPNVQQGVAEGLASMLRGGNGGANVGLLKIELAKRGWAQGAIDGLVSNYAGAVNTLFDNANKPYLSGQTQRQIRDVMDVLKTYNDANVSDRVANIATRAGALGLDTSALGLGTKEANGAVGEALEAGRVAQIARMMPNHQAIGGGDGVFQLNAQAAGAGASGLPAGTSPTTQLPGARPLATPVQQATMPPGPGIPPTVPPGPGGRPLSPVVNQPPQSGGGQPSPAGGPSAPMPIAGQTVNVPALPPGATPNYIASLQRIESGNEKNPWTAGTANSSAGGAFQFINSTWAANKPPGAPDRAKDATPQQQTEALATLTAKNAAALQSSGLPVNDTNLYIAHNLGEGGGPALLKAPLTADARTVVGEAAARNNPTFFKGKPTVATVIGRYQAEMAKDIDASVPQGPAPKPGAGGAAAEAPPSLMTRVARALSSGMDPAAGDAARARVGTDATEHAPAIGSVIGAAAGSVGGPAGTVAGGAAGGGAGQALKDYLQGRTQSPAAIAKQTALGGVLGVGSAARPVLSAVARAAGAGGVEAGATAAEGGTGPEVLDAGAKGAALAAGGELFGRALGMIGHKVFSLFSPNAQKTVQTAAGKYAEAGETLAKEAPTIPGVNGGPSTPNPKYAAAEQARTDAERVLKDAGLKPDEAAYAHKVSSEGVPKQEAEVSRPGALEKDAVGAGYQQLENEVGAAGVGAPKAAPKLSDGPLAAVESNKVSAKHAELATEVEMAITAPAPDWQTKWVQLKDARSKLLTLERDAMNSTAPGKSRIAENMRTLADTVRAQQEKAAKYVFGEKDGEAFMARLKVLDVRYRNLMEATNGGDLTRAATLKGEAGREAEKKFVAFAHDDPQAVAAYRAMRGAKGDLAEATVPWTVAAEGLPVIGKVVKIAKLGGILQEWARERAAGSPVRFSDLARTNAGAPEVGQAARDVMGSAVQRGAVMQ